MESALIGSLFAAMPCGQGYGFSIYSEAMQHQLQLTGGQILSVNTLNTIVCAFGPIWGALARQLGPALALLVGGAAMCFNLTSQYLISSKAVTLGIPPVITLVLLSCVGQFGQQLTTAVAFTTPVKYYQQRRGIATSVAKSFVGLGGVCIAQVFWLAVSGEPDFDKLGPDALLDLLLWAGVVVIGCLGGALLIPKEPNPDPKKESDFRLGLLFWILLAWGICTSVLALITNHTAHLIIAIVLIAALLFLPVLLAFWTIKGPVFNSGGSASGSFESPTIMNFQAMIRTSECWCLFVCSVAVCGGGVVISNSMSDILTAAGNQSDDANVLANTLFSTGNMLGRLLCMLPSDRLVRRGLPRPLAISVVVIIMAIAHALFLFLPAAGGSQLIFAPAAFLGGFSYGSLFPHMVVLTSELFGTKYLPDNYMLFDGGTNFLASIVLSRMLAGGVLDAHTPSMPGSVCIGSGCFAVTHVVLLVLNMLSIPVALLMARNSRPVYRHIHQSLHADADEHLEVSIISESSGQKAACESEQAESCS